MTAHQVMANGDVTISGEDAFEIGRLLRLLTPSENSTSGLIRSVHRLQQQKHDRRPLDRRQLMAAARQLYIQRRARSRHFPEHFFGEPAWDMLLALYATGDDAARQSVSNLIQLASCPPTTALRYLSSLEEERLVERQAHPTDRRVFYIELSVKGREAIENYLSSTDES